MAANVAESVTNHVELDIRLRHLRPNGSGPDKRAGWTRRWSGRIEAAVVAEHARVLLDVTPEEAALVRAFRQLSGEETRASFVDTLEDYVATGY